MKVNRTMDTTCSVTARGRWFSDMGKGPRGSRIDRLLMIAAQGAGGREKVKLFAGGDQLRGDQGGQCIFFTAKTGQQGGLFLGGEAVPDLDHFLGSADENAGLGFAE